LKPIYINARFLTQRTSGVHRFAQEIALIIKREIPEALFLAPQNVLESEFLEKLDVKRIGFTSGHLWEQIELPLYLSRKPGILLNLCNVAPLFWRSNILVLHDLSFFENPTWFNWKFRMFYQFLIPKISLKSIHLFTVSEFSHNEIVNKLRVPSSKITVVYNAVSVRMTPIKTKRKTHQILTVGSIDPRKNFKVIIAALKLLDLKYNLVIVGGRHGSFNEENIDEVEDERITFTGYLSEQDLVEYYCQSSLFIFPSLYEGFGIPPLEALNCNCPIILSDIPVHREIYQDTAMYFEPNSPVELKNAIEAFSELSDVQKNDLRIKGKEYTKNYNWERSGIKIANYLKGVI
jgi:glycosyltransferase involved in cell wall biosynthesis